MSYNFTGTDIKGKKLLLLGGTALLCDLVAKAKEMGVYTIVTDWNAPEKSPAKQIADEYWMIDISDTAQLVQMARMHAIDGVLTNYTDSYLPYYVALCEALNLPCLANVRQIETITNKELSKQLCIDHGIKVSKRYDVKNVEDIGRLEVIGFPVLTKPVDNSGQRGVFVCQNKEDLKRAYISSLEFSPSKNVIVEEFVQGDYIVMFYTVQNGRVTLSAVADKPVYGNYEYNLPKLPLGYLLPSRYVAHCQQKMLPKVQSFVTDLGIKNGVIGIEAVFKNEEVFVFEMQFRLGGMQHHNFVREENGMDLLAMHVCFALTGKFECWDTSVCDNADFKHTYCSLNILVHPDKIFSIEGLEETISSPSVFFYTQMMNIGSHVGLPGTVQQIFAKFSLKTDSRRSMKEAISEVFDTLKVFNEKGENIVIDSRENMCKALNIGLKS